ncbi:MAG TPA: TadE/TadG family type IV pilus assembly protein [Gemmatimonadales bacterium]|jgi:Flp pilus assembly protein TadG|nr:TadE/TadG family type IV pilus assembly protein [Gemmatimonadales bacterium]
MRRLFRRHRDADRGQALVEFGLVLPLLLLLIFGLVDLGRAVYAQNALSEAARDGARWGSVQARAGNDIPGIEAYTVDRVDAIGGVTATATCTASSVLGCSPNDVLTVRAEADLEMITPVLAQLMGAMGLNPLHLSSTSEVLVNN